MDITFICDKCGQHISVDEAGAGITVDCPRCGKPTYVPSRPVPDFKSTPTRIDVGSAKPSNAPPPPISMYESAKRVSTAGGNQDTMHPAVAASLTCLLVYAGCFLLCIIVVRQYPLLASICPFAAIPFAIGAVLCAIYAMCVGHVKHGVLLLAGVSLINVVGLFAYRRAMVTGLLGGMQDIQNQFEQQFKQLPH